MDTAVMATALKLAPEAEILTLEEVTTSTGLVSIVPSEVMALGRVVMPVVAERSSGRDTEQVAGGASAPPPPHTVALSVAVFPNMVVEPT